jgi:hypothetical protein
MTEKATRYIPRWLHYQANVSADLTGFVFTEIPPNTFANETIWPYHLEYLTITGFPPGVPTGGVTPGGFFGGIGNNINLELGISGVSDINQVSATATTIMGLGKREILCPPYQLFGGGGAPPYYDSPLTVKLKYPYLLAKGNGFNVEFRNSIDDYQFTAAIIATTYQASPSFAAYGRSVAGNNPIMLAGTFRTTNDPDVAPSMPKGGGISLVKADLLNDGSDDVLIDTLCFTYNELYGINADGSSFGVMPPLFSEYLVNPINGIKWMPGADPLPIMGLCPGSFPWPVRSGTQASAGMPVTYEFPASTVLRRRQRLSVSMSNRCLYPEPPKPVVSLPVRVNVTLFGYLEVR